MGAVAIGLLVWGWPGAVGRWHHNMACVQRNQGLYGPGLSDGERAGRAGRAVAGYERALATTPGLAAAHRNLGALYYGAATREETAHSISRTTHLDFEPAAFFDGVEVPADGYLPAAVEHLERALQLAPGDVVAGYFLERARSQ